MIYEIIVVGAPPVPAGKAMDLLKKKLNNNNVICKNKNVCKNNNVMNYVTESWSFFFFCIFSVNF